MGRPTPLCLLVTSVPWRTAKVMITSANSSWFSMVSENCSGLCLYLPSETYCAHSPGRIDVGKEPGLSWFLFQPSKGFHPSSYCCLVRILFDNFVSFFLGGWKSHRKAVTTVTVLLHGRGTRVGTHFTKGMYKKSQSSTRLNTIIRTWLFLSTKE